MTINRSWPKYVVLILAIHSSQAWAAEQKAETMGVKQNYTFQGFGFGGHDECKGVEVLNYQYGSVRTTGLHADAGYLATGHIPQGESSFGMFPIGDRLYVKWKDLADNKVYEEDIDLKGRLPTDMNQKILHFSIKGPQLFINVIDGLEKKNLHGPNAPDCPVEQFSMFKCATIYPQYCDNF